MARVRYHLECWRLPDGISSAIFLGIPVASVFGIAGLIATYRRSWLLAVSSFVASSLVVAPLLSESDHRISLDQLAESEFRGQPKSDSRNRFHGLNLFAHLDSRCHKHDCRSWIPMVLRSTHRGTERRLSGIYDQFGTSRLRP